jgi:hypothetical protein
MLDHKIDFQQFVGVNESARRSNCTEGGIRKAIRDGHLLYEMTLDGIKLIHLKDLNDWNKTRRRKSRRSGKSAT